jgi:hypothetical protein
VLEDPRKDLKEDTEIWQVLLTAAGVEDMDLCNTLRGFRSAGCRLALDHTKNNLSFNFGTEASDEERDIIKKYAKNYKEHIKKIFKRVYNGISRSRYEKKSE